MSPGELTTTFLVDASSRSLGRRTSMRLKPPAATCAGGEERRRRRTTLRGSRLLSGRLRDAGELGVLVDLAADRVLELAHPAPEGAPRLREALRPQDQQGDDEDDPEFHRSDVGHLRSPYGWLRATVLRRIERVENLPRRFCERGRRGLQHVSAL